ncbi:MAG: hypothetical protein AAF917_04185, partial [Pseudomonadota bacterium]
LIVRRRMSFMSCRNCSAMISASSGARFVAKRSPAGKRLDLSIAHALAPDDAEIMAEQFRQDIKDIRRLTISELGTAIGVHGGPGTLVVSTQPVDA